MLSQVTHGAARSSVRARYGPGAAQRGYLDEVGVAEDSTTETYAALRLDIENWRWSGVPFFIRAGKGLPITQTEIRLVFKHPPELGFAVLAKRREPNQLVIRLDPGTGVQMILDARRADATQAAPIQLDVTFAEMGGEGATPYEVLLHAAMVGMDAGAAEFQKLAARGEEGGQVEFGFGVEAPGGGAAVGVQDAVGADDMGFGRGVDSAVDKKKMVEERVEGVTLKARRVVDQRAVTAKFADEDLVAQALRSGQVLGRGGQPHDIGGFFGRHRR